MLHLPADAPRGGIVVCHPHPQYGGDMHSAVVVAVASALAGAGFAALRFNFGGVGGSGGRYDDGGEEQCDVGAAEAALAARVPGVPRALVGYSFGAWVAAMASRGLPHVERVVAIAPPLAFFDWSFVSDLRAPLDVVVGDRDQYCSADALARLTSATNREIPTPGAREARDAPKALLEGFAERTPSQPTLLPAADHFLGGREADVARAVLACLEG